MTETTSHDSDVLQEHELTAHVRDHACEYYPQFGQADVDVELVNKWQRNNSHLYRFELRPQVPEWRLGRERRLYVKVPTARGGTRNGDRPYLIPETDPAIKFQLHYQALQAIHEHFEKVDDPRFGSVRILELLPESGAFVMDEAPGRTIRQLLTRSSRLHPRGEGLRSLEQAFRNIGGWLRVYHTMDGVDGEVIHDRREDFIRNINRFTGFLADAVGEGPFFRRLAEDVAMRAESSMPEELPLGLRFGDFGLTNILVGRNECVTAIDTLARWRAPIYEDIAWFLTGLKAYNLQVFSQGLAFNRQQVTGLEGEFLTGYFGHETIPRSDIRLFEILRLLERWSAKVARNRRRSAVAGRLGRALANRFFRKKISELLASVPESSIGLAMPTGQNTPNRHAGSPA